MRFRAHLFSHSLQRANCVLDLQACHWGAHRTSGSQSNRTQRWFVCTQKGWSFNWLDFSLFLFLDTTGGSREYWEWTATQCYPVQARYAEEQSKAVPNRVLGEHSVPGRWHPFFSLQLNILKQSLWFARFCCLIRLRAITIYIFFICVYWGGVTLRSIAWLHTPSPVSQPPKCWEFTLFCGLSRGILCSQERCYFYRPSL